jgi:hypothetical protein
MAQQTMSPELKRKQAQEKDLQWLKGQMSGLMFHRFYGKITLVMEDGRLRRIVKEESVLPPPEE